MQQDENVKLKNEDERW